MKVKLFFMALLCAFVVGRAGAIELVGTADVNVTSDTAATAKNMAFDEARRQIIMDSLRQYADVDALQSAVKKAKASELMTLISASSIDGEQLSDTTYSAKIAMTVDDKAARDWLERNAVQNWLPDAENRDVFVVDATMSGGLRNWIELNKIARAEKLDLGTVQISANNARLELPTSLRGRFTIALREAGWRYQTKDGVLKIWK